MDLARHLARCMLLGGAKLADQTTSRGQRPNILLRVGNEVELRGLDKQLEGHGKGNDRKRSPLKGIIRACQGGMTVTLGVSVHHKNSFMSPYQRPYR